ncbi:MAG: 2-polyprenylphenol hydroxylase [Planctomycetes bacterium SCN 63-9]|nr:MAG: 2-polyprenylphenol hydroxylase [Planctomycetes bacterium SCN 63-9]
MNAVAPACARYSLAEVVENVPMARGTYRLRLADAALAGSIRPGQFLMIRPGPEGSNEPLLGRPFALYDIVREKGGAATAVDVVYLVIGKGTSALAQRKPGDRLAIWGPLGNGFEPLASDASNSPLFVAGGIGQTPFLALGRWWLGRESYGTELAPGSTNLAPSAALFYGVRNKDYLAGVEDFRNAGIEVEIATDDGSEGHHGFVTDLLTRRLERGDQPGRIVGCGPPGMLAALSRIAARNEIPCDVSLENHMACGFGACFSCVAPIRQPDGSADLRRVCVEGPIFPAESVDWGRAGH